ncbi:MAG: hypothetical protein K5873_03700 [Treponema sp.]|nr:hypothetical protein [Treponema sp.]
MLQFYFLSIFLNILAGLIFIYAAKDGGETSMLLSDSDDPFSAEVGEPSSQDFTPETDEIDFNEDSSQKDKKKSAHKSLSFKELAAPFLADKTLQLVVGILSGLTGLMKLLSPIQYDIAVIGDFIPALACLASSAVLLLDWYQERSEIELTLPELVQNIYKGGRKYMGIFCIISACLHFIFPRVLFL